MKPDKPRSRACNSDTWQLRLYIAGYSPKAIEALTNLKKICEDHLAGRYTIEIVDLLESPHLGRRDQIHALPTLVRRVPEPATAIIGDLSNTARVLLGLNIGPADAMLTMRQEE